MLYHKGGLWHFCAEKVRYIQHGKEITQHVGEEGKQWWLDFAAKWDHTEIIEFVPVEATEDQITRLEEINQLRIPDGFGSMLTGYVQDGAFPEGLAHPLRQLQIAKEQERQDQDIADAFYELMKVGV